MVFNTIFIE